MENIQPNKASMESEEGLRDITGRRHAEQSLRESEQKYRNLVGNSPDLILLVDRKSRKIIEVNNAACRTMGYPRNELEGAVSGGRVVPEQTIEYKRLLDKIDKVGYGTGVFDVCRKDGSVITVAVHGSAFGSYLLTVGRDITDEVKLEEQLRHSQKMEAIGTLAGGIAHDFNNIITAIMGFTTILDRRMDEDDPLKLYVDHIQTAAENAANLTSGLLTFSRKQKINPMFIDLNKIIRKVQKFLRRIIGEDIEFKTDLYPDILNVEVDFNQIEQVLMNLVSNSRDAMPGGGILTISTEQVEINSDFIKSHGYGEQGTYALILITDTGIGLDEDARKKIFEPFYTTKEVDKGTGLGLSIVYGIIKQHQGYINVSSTLGKGSMFMIYLPIRKQASDPLSEEETVDMRSLGGTETILIAEDDEMILSVITSFLTDSGYRVIAAQDGDDAVKKFMDNRDDVRILVSDVMMPGKKGKDVYEEIRLIRPDVKVLFLSGYPADVIYEKGLMNEGVNFLSKPINPPKLLRKIRTILDGEGKIDKTEG